MKIHGIDKTISEIFSPKNVKYIVPRFQREYSWGKSQIQELWNDINNNIQIINGEYRVLEYFIGPLVLIGDDKGTSIDICKEFQIVDGQQRLTTITIILSALVQTFKNLNVNDSAKGLYDYIEGADDDSKKFFKLVNESPKPYFQNCIQQYKKRDEKTVSKEEERLQYAYNLINKNLDEKKIKYKNDEEYIKYLKALRSQILKLKTIFITVGNEEEAYTIFETLNARGINLEAVDLIKNSLFKVLNYDHPDDDAQTIWRAIRNELIYKKNSVNIDKFFRHYWISKYEFSTQKALYRSFKNTIKLNNVDHTKNSKIALDFLYDMKNEATYYMMVTNPNEDDWHLQEEKVIYKSLCVLKLFGVTQVNTILIALLAQYKSKKINVNDFCDAVKYLEKFHFIYSTISSYRTSSIERKYSKNARNIRSSKSKNSSKKSIDQMKADFNEKLPNYSAFLAGITNLWYTKDNDSDKKIIQYIYTNIENYFYPTEELSVYKFSLEHISSQKDSTYKKHVGNIGNLLPLAQPINQEADVLDYICKIDIYRKSKLRVVNKFINKYGNLKEWTDKEIKERNSDIAKLAYDIIWKIN